MIKYKYDSLSFSLSLYSFNFRNQMQCNINKQNIRSNFTTDAFLNDMIEDFRPFKHITSGNQIFNNSMRKSI